MFKHNQTMTRARACKGRPHVSISITTSSPYSWISKDNEEDGR